MELFEKLQALRKAAGLSQEELAENLEVSRQAVSKWEAGASLPELGKLVAMSKLYKVTMNELLQLEEPSCYDAASASGLEGLTPAQLAQIQAILAAYDTPPEEPEVKKHHGRNMLIAAVAVAALIFSINVISSNNLQENEIRGLTDGMNYLRDEISAIDYRLASLGHKNTEENQAFGEFTYDYEADVLKNEMTITISLTPKIIKEDMSLKALVTWFDKNGKAASLSLPMAAENGLTFSASVTIPLCDLVEITPIITSGGEKNVLPKGIISDALRVSVLRIFPLPSSAGEARFDITTTDKLYPVSGKIIIERLRDGKSEILATEQMAEAAIKEITTGVSLTVTAKIPVINLDTMAGDIFTYSLIMTDNLGIEYRNTFYEFEADENGQLMAGSDDKRNSEDEWHRASPTDLDTVVTMPA